MRSPTTSRRLPVRDLSRLERLVEVDGTSGCEDDVREVMRTELKLITSKIEIDKFGNLLGHYNSKRTAPLIMLVSHMDEVGMMIKWIRPDGYLAFDLSGVVDPAILPSQWVRIHTRKGIVKGIIGVRAGHFAGKELQKPDHRTMWIDVGVTSREEARELGIREGDFVTYDRPLMYMNEGRYVYGKALDNRVGCVVMIETGRDLIAERIQCNVAMVGSVMEELGGLGAGVAASNLKPDVAIVLDGIPASDPAVKPEQSAVFVGAGPVITRAESSIPKANVTPKWLFDLALEAAEEKGIPYQVDVNSIFYSDASSVSVSGKGVPTIPISVARRNSHTPAEIVSTQDIEHTIRLVTSLVKKLSSKKITRP